MKNNGLVDYFQESTVGLYSPLHIHIEAAGAAVFNATLKHISVIPWRSVLLVE